MIFFFSANDSVANTELWISDGTAQATAILKNLKAFSSYPREFTELNGKLFFVANGSIHVTDSTKEGTFSLVSGKSDFCFGLIGFKDKLYYTNTDGVHDYELWVTDGSAPGHMLIDINPSGIGLDNDPAFTRRRVVLGDHRRSAERREPDRFPVPPRHAAVP